MARPSLARRLGAATLLTALVLTAAACGGESDTAATDGASSSDATGEGTDAGEEIDAPSGELDELSAEEFYPAVMAALQEAETMGFTLTTTGGPTATDLDGVIRFDDDGIDMQASSTGAQAMEMVILDKLLYISGVGMPLPDGKTWLKVDLSDPDSLFGQLGKATDPSVMFKAMESPKEFEVLGTEEVDGVETTHYNVVMDTAAYGKALDMPAEMMQFLPKEIGVEMWVDADDQPRRFRQELELPAMTDGGEPTQTTTEGTYTDFGTDVVIEAPPAGEVADDMPGMG